jgi:hypothetical protein
MAALDAALKGQAQAQEAVHTAGAAEAAAHMVSETKTLRINQPEASVDSAQAAIENVADQGTGVVVPVVLETPKPAPKPVVAVRGDDRPGMKKDAPAPAQGRGKWNDRKDAPRGGREDKAGFAPRGDRPERSSTWTDAPRLGDTAFRAQRDALEHAEFALKRLAAQAHGEALTQLLTAWEKRDAALVPSTQELGARASAVVRSAWVQALAPNAKAVPKSPAPQEALLRLEMAAELPTPAEFLNDRRALQLQLLTRRNDAPPAQTWGPDTAAVLLGGFTSTDARRLQNVLKVLLKR